MCMYSDSSLGALLVISNACLDCRQVELYVCMYHRMPRHESAALHLRLIVQDSIESCLQIPPMLVFANAQAASAVSLSVCMYRINVKRPPSNSGGSGFLARSAGAGGSSDGSGGGSAAHVSVPGHTHTHSVFLCAVEFAYILQLEHTASMWAALLACCVKMLAVCMC